ncbi:kisspeptin 2 [Esox lucius]|uniref:Kisspeptin n=1 Tax=Esox lucius TaxID=8010 RepID=A0AAY5KET0_ESOLU|nr:kisspeptin 2 [Esox lucius]
MRMLAFILLFAIIPQNGTSGTQGLGRISQWTDIPGHFPAMSKVGHSLKRNEVFGPNIPDDALCYLLKENEEPRQLICKHLLTRTSKFNFNPFGLRFGKRANGYPSKVNLTRSKTSKLLPILLYLREVQAPA